MPVPALRPGLSMEIRKPLGDTLLLAARKVSVPELSAATSMAGKPKARHRAEAPAWAQAEEDLVAAAVVEEDMAGAAGTGDRKLILFMECAKSSNGENVYAANQAEPRRISLPPSYKSG